MYFLGQEHETIQHCVNVFGLSTSIGVTLDSPYSVDITEKEQLKATATATTVSLIYLPAVLGEYEMKFWEDTIGGSGFTQRC